MSLTMTVKPNTEPVDVARAMRQLRITDELSAEEEGDLLELAAGAREEVETLMGRCAGGVRTYVLLVELVHHLALADRGHYQYLHIELPMPPLVAITTVKTLDCSGVSTTLGTDAYTLNTVPSVPVVRITALPADAWQVEITYQAGYAVLTDIPREYLLPMLLRMTQRYMYPTGIGEKDDAIFTGACRRYSLNPGVG